MTQSCFKPILATVKPGALTPDKVAYWAAASIAFAREPLRERYAVGAPGGGWTYAVRPLGPARHSADA